MKRDIIQIAKNIEDKMMQYGCVSMKFQTGDIEDIVLKVINRSMSNPETKNIIIETIEILQHNIQINYSYGCNPHCDEFNKERIYEDITEGWTKGTVNNVENEVIGTWSIVNPYKEIAAKLHWVLTYIRTYASYPVADNVMQEYEQLLKDIV